MLTRFLELLRDGQRRVDLGEGVEESEGAIFVPEFAYVLPNEILRKCYQIDHDLG